MSIHPWSDYQPRWSNRTSRVSSSSPFIGSPSIIACASATLLASSSWLFILGKMCNPLHQIFSVDLNQHGQMNSIQVVDDNPEIMTHVVTSACMNHKYQDCVAVCPVEAFRELDTYLVIDPDECIDCGACSASTTSIMTPPCCIRAKPRLSKSLPCRSCEKSVRVMSINPCGGLPLQEGWLTTTFDLGAKNR